VSLKVWNFGRRKFPFRDLPTADSQESECPNHSGTCWPIGSLRLSGRKLYPGALESAEEESLKEQGLTLDSSGQDK
jgi:hypothetical protein